MHLTKRMNTHYWVYITSAIDVSIKMGCWQPALREKKERRRKKKGLLINGLNDFLSVWVFQLEAEAESNTQI
jgi:hypothetical protein